MDVEIQYGVTFGKCDSSDWMEWTVMLTEEEVKFYDRAYMLRIPFNDVPELEDALSRAYEEIEEQEIEILLENEDEYTQECTGQYPVDAEELTELVRDRDEHAISFLGLEELTDEELDVWDASELDELPNVCDFDESFEPESPFDCGWSLNVEFIELLEEEDIRDGEIEEALRLLFSEADGDYSEVREYIERMESDFWDQENVGKTAYAIAEELNLTTYLEEYADEASEDEG